MTRWHLVLAPLLALSFAAGPARAADDSAATFQAAKKLYEAKSYEKALPLFQDAFANSKSPNAHVFIARCLRELGRTAEAYEQMAATVREATALAATDPKYVPTRDSAAAELALLESQVGRIVIAVDDQPGLELLVNGKALEPARRGDVVAVPPGAVQIEARATGKEAVRKQENVAAGQLKTLALRFDEGGSGATSGDKGAAPTAAAPSSRGDNFAGGSKGFEGLRPELGVAILGGPNIYVPDGGDTIVVGTFWFAIKGNLLVDRFDLGLEISPLTWMPDTQVLDNPVFQTNLNAGYHIPLAGPLNWVLRGGVGMAVGIHGGPTNFVGRADLVALSALAGPLMIEIDAPSFRAVTDFHSVSLDPVFGGQFGLMLDDL